MKTRELQNVLKILAVITFLILLAWFLIRISWVIKIAVVSLLIVYVLFPIAEFLKNRFRLSHAFAVAVTFSFFLILIFTLISLIVPIVQHEMRNILSDLPYYARHIQLYIQDISDFLASFDLSPEFMDSFPELSTNMQPLLEELGAISISVVASIVDIFFVAFIVLYLLYDFQNVRNAVLKLVPLQYERYARDVLQIIDQNFGGYIRGNIVRCTLVGIFTGVLLFILGMPYALLLGILAGVLNVVLYIGPCLAALPAVILSFSPQTPSLIIVIIVYLTVQTVDGIVLSPLLLGRAVKLKPITIIFCLLIGEQLAGFLGIILSIPLAGIARALIEYIHAQRKALKRPNV